MIALFRGELVDLLFEKLPSAVNILKSTVTIGLYHWRRPSGALIHERTKRRKATRAVKVFI
jgi:hypothetical protein